MKKHALLIVDDHTLFSNSLKRLIDLLGDFAVLGQCKNGKEMIKWLTSQEDVPDIILLDVNMPIMDGIQSMEWIKANRPNQKVLALSMEENDQTMLKMLKNGVRGYILKEIEPQEFKNALNEVINTGYYYSTKVSTVMRNELAREETQKSSTISRRELDFLNLACSEKTYKEIADELFLSPKTIDGYRESLFRKVGVKSRIGLVIYAIKNDIVRI